MTASAVSYDLNRYEREYDAAQAREEMIEARVTELLTDAGRVSGALDFCLGNLDRTTLADGSLGSLALTDFIAEHIINGSRLSAVVVLDHLRDMAVTQLYVEAAREIDKEFQFRITAGVARYTTSFTPPASQFPDTDLRKEFQP